MYDPRIQEDLENMLAQKFEYYVIMHPGEVVTLSWPGVEHFRSKREYWKFKSEGRRYGATQHIDYLIPRIYSPRYLLFKWKNKGSKEK
jgi:hypothetical protein